MVTKRNGMNEFSTVKEMNPDTRRGRTGRAAGAGSSDHSAGTRPPQVQEATAETPATGVRNAAKAEALCECDLLCHTIRSFLGCSFHPASRGEHFSVCGACRGGEGVAGDTVFGVAVPAGSAWWVSPKKGGNMCREGIGHPRKGQGQSRGVRRRQSGCEPQSCCLPCDLWHEIL